MGRALAQRLGWEFLDIEDCFFPKTDPSYLYANPRSPQEAAALLVERATAAENFVLASVKGHYPGLAPLLTGAVWLRVDKATRARRVRQRSYQGHPGPAGAAALLREVRGANGPRGRPVPAGGGVLRLYRPAGGQRGGGLAGHVTLPRGGGGRHLAHRRTAKWRPGWPRYAAPWWRWTALCPSRRMWSSWPAAFPAHKTQETSRRGAFPAAFVLRKNREGRQKLPALFRGKI